MSEAVETRSLALLARLRQFNTAAHHVPSLALRHFARALNDDLGRLPYLDMSVRTDAGELAGRLVALTDAGVLIELSYRDDDEPGPVTIRPLRGRVARLELSYGELAVLKDLIPAGAVSITLDGEHAATILLPLTPRTHGASFLGPIVAALGGA